MQPWVLVVDDSATDRAFLASRLRRLFPDVRLATAPSGEEALRLLDADDPPRLVLSDYDMGEGMTGLDLLAAVRERHPGTPRVLVTGTPRERLPLADVPVLAKPLQPAQLLHALGARPDA